MSADTELEAEEIRRALDGGEGVTALLGLGQSPAIFRRRAPAQGQAFSRLYSGTWRVHLISSFLAGVLAGEPEAPIDWGNGSGTSLMDWSGLRWAPQLLAAVGEGLPGGTPPWPPSFLLSPHPLAIVGRVAAYFRERYGIPGDCAIVAGSGDNPQSKVLAEGTLLSLGTSFVIMTEGKDPTVRANAMYDGLGRPFLFGCRTNGALSWEAVRKARARLRRLRARRPPSPPVRPDRRCAFCSPSASPSPSPVLLAHARRLRRGLCRRRGLLPRPRSPRFRALSPARAISR